MSDAPDYTTPYTAAEIDLMEAAFKADPGPWTPRNTRLLATIREKERFLSEEKDRSHMLDQEHARWKFRAVEAEAKLRELERDVVPRSRYDACNADWLEEKALRLKAEATLAEAIALIPQEVTSKTLMEAAKRANELREQVVYVEQLADVLRTMLMMCEDANRGAWHNGVSHDGIEEGDVLAEKVMAAARAALAKNPATSASSGDATKAMRYARQARDAEDAVRRDAERDVLRRADDADVETDLGADHDALDAALAKNPAQDDMAAHAHKEVGGNTCGYCGGKREDACHEIVTTPFNPGGRPCAACGAPVWLPTTRYQPAVFIFNDRVWHGYCAPKSGESLGVDNAPKAE